MATTTTRAEGGRAFVNRSVGVFRCKRHQVAEFGCFDLGHAPADFEVVGDRSEARPCVCCPRDLGPYRRRFGSRSVPGMPRSKRALSRRGQHTASSAGQNTVRENRWLIVFGLLGGLVLAFAIGAGVLAMGFRDTPTGTDGTDSATLVSGERVYMSQCATCHKPDGSGGSGPALGNGVVVEKYPNIAAQIQVITDGRGAMPAFGDKLSPEMIQAVAIYEREELGR